MGSLAGMEVEDDDAISRSRSRSGNDALELEIGLEQQDDGVDEGLIEEGGESVGEVAASRSRAEEEDHETEILVLSKDAAAYLYGALDWRRPRWIAGRTDADLRGTRERVRGRSPSSSRARARASSEPGVGV